MATDAMGCVSLSVGYDLIVVTGIPPPNAPVQPPVFHCPSTYQAVVRGVDGIATDRDGTADLLVQAWTAVREGVPAAEVYSVLTTDRSKTQLSWFGTALSLGTALKPGRAHLCLSGFRRPTTATAH